jgi:Uncharacterised nucleotidyltransferase
LDELPPSIPDMRLLGLLGGILAVRNDLPDTAALRLKFFSSEFSWQALVDLATTHGVLAPLIFALSRRTLLPPVPNSLRGLDAEGHVTNRLNAAYGQHLARRDDLRRQLADSLATLNARGIVPILLKGARHLIDPALPWAEAREMRDLDLLISSQEGEGALAALVALGYVAEPHPPPIDQHLPELQREGHATIELHTHALAFNARKLLTTAEVRARAVPQDFAGRRCLVLPDEWHLLHGLLNHQVSDRGHARHVLAIKGLWELAILGNELSEPGWRSISAHLLGHGQADILASWLVQANRLFGLRLPDGVEISDAARAHADTTFRTAHSPDWMRWGRFTADKLAFAFARETLAVRYDMPEQEVTAGEVVKHLTFLVRMHAGNIVRKFRHRRGGGS